MSDGSSRKGGPDVVGVLGLLLSLFLAYVLLQRSFENVR